MALVLLLVLIVVPIAELFVIVQVARGIGTLETIALLIVVSLAGTWLLKREGMATWARLNAQLKAGKMPTKEVTDGALIMLGGALLLTPGFLTDIVGLALVFPPTRAMVKGVFRKALAGWVIKKHPAGYAGYRVYDASVTRSRRSNPAQPPLSHEVSPPVSDPASDEDGSPGRG